jgi:hypothetical protein
MDTNTHKLQPVGCQNVSLGTQEARYQYQVRALGSKRTVATVFSNHAEIVVTGTAGQKLGRANDGHLRLCRSFHDET